jgi:alkylation response protein AidB-like acyl-CoA dehydrogenase
MIDLSLSPIQSDLVTSVRDAAAKEFPLTAGVNAAVSGPVPFDAARWSRIAALGWFSVGVAEDAGGIGLGSPEELLVMTELGRAAASGPVVGTALAARLAAAANQVELAGALMAGERRAGLISGAFAVDAEDGDLAVRITAEAAEIVELSGTTAVESNDPLATVVRPAETRTVLRVPDPLALSRLRLLVGGYLVGLAETATDMAVEYAKTREQFGKAIGTFQAVKHRCSEMVIRAYPARIQLSVGAVLLDSEISGSGRLEIASGHLLALDAARRNVEDNIQNHGGIGFTAEHPAGVLVKRVMVYRHLGGDPDELVREVLSAPKADVA